MSIVEDKPETEKTFAELISGVKKLETDRVNIYPHRVRKDTPAKKSPQQDFAALSYQQLSHISESYFSSGLQKKLQRNLRQGKIHSEGHLDLHGCTQQQATRELGLFIGEALDRGYTSLIIVHGKGNRSDNSSVLKPLVRHWLACQSQVLAWCPAQPEDGGSGASYVYLRKVRE